MDKTIEQTKEVIELLTQLKFKGFLKKYKSLVKGEDLDSDEMLIQLCNAELDSRYKSKVKRKISDANFPKVKTVAMLDFEKTPLLDKKTVKELQTCEFIDKKENLILVGDSGGGKSHLAIALGLEACKKNYSVKFFTACQLVNLLLDHYKEGTIEKFMAKLKKYQLCIVDELGYVPFSKKGAKLLFQVFSDRYETGSMIVTSNLKFSKWTEVFIDTTMTTALLDRLTHFATIIKYTWGSVRFNHAVEEHIKRDLIRS